MNSCIVLSETKNHICDGVEEAACEGLRSTFETALCSHVYVNVIGGRSSYCYNVEGVILLEQTAH